MKKHKITWCVCVVLLICSTLGPGSGSFLMGQGLDDLSANTSQSLIDFFKEQHNVRTAIVKFENFSGASGQVAQKFYQLLVSKLETVTGISFTDLMINFQQNRGTFNLNRIHPLNYLIYIRLVRNKTKLGAGVSVFSQNLDKIVFVKYVETYFSVPEQEFYESESYGFKSTGFSRVMEMTVEDGLLDARSILNRDGRLLILFYYRDKIDFLGMNGNRLQKFYSYPLKWKRPYYPVMKPEGKLSVFFDNSVLYVTAGGNFSSRAFIIAFTGKNSQETGGETGFPDSGSEAELNFVPFRLIVLNGSRYIAGARYVVGKNYFEDKLVLLPLDGDSGSISQTGGDTTVPLEREVTPFYALDYSTAPGSHVLDSIHLIDRNYTYRFFADNFQPMTEETGKRGAALGVLDGEWLAVSDYSNETDKLYFYKIEAGSRQLVFENPVEGEIQFISGGLWKAAPGFWVYVKKQTSHTGRPEYKLQFWSKKSEQPTQND